jgi:hypothetical protein
MSKISLKLVLALLGSCLMIYGCGAGIENGDGSVLVVNTKSLPAEGVLKLRWFPVNDATGYRLYAENSAGAVVESASVMPQNCTHSTVEGYTSGVCELEYDISALPKQSVLRIKAFNPEGESLPSGKVSY